MNRLDRYLLLAVLRPSSLAFAVSSVFFLAQEINERSRSILAQVVEFTDLARLTFYLFPSLLPYVLPVTLFFGVLAGYGKLAERGELTAMFAAGMSARRMFAPSIVLAGTSIVAIVAIQNYLQPLGFSRAYNLIRAELPARATIDRLEPGVVHKIGNSRIYFHSSDPDLNEVYGVDVVRFEPGQVATVFHAESAHVVKEPFGQSLVLGRGFTVSSDRIRSSMERAILRIPGPDLTSGSLRKTRSGSSLQELFALDRDLTAAEEESSTPSNRLELRKTRQEISDRLSLPFAALGLAAIAPPLVIWLNRNRRTSRVRSFAIGLGILVAFYVARTMLQPEDLVALEAALALGWLPNVAVLAAALLMYRRLARAAG